jgi:hypothetical protein
MATKNPEEELERELELEQANAFEISVEMLRTFKEYLRVRRERNLDGCDANLAPDSMLREALDGGADPEAWIDWLVERLIDSERMTQEVE